MLISLLQNRWDVCQNFLLWIHVLMTRTRTAFELKLQKANKTTDLRIPASVCTMFNVLVDAKKQSTKLCALDGGQEVSGWSVPNRNAALVPWQRTMLCEEVIHWIRSQKTTFSNTSDWSFLHPPMECPLSLVSVNFFFFYEDCLKFCKWPLSFKYAF